jgi:hypothetical protein
MVQMSHQPETRNQKLETRFTRRTLGAVLATSVVVLAQTPASPLPSNPDEELKVVRDAIRQNSEALAKVEVPMSAEPAVHFRA